MALGLKRMLIYSSHQWIAACLGLLLLKIAAATTLVLPVAGNLAGEVQRVTSQPGETLGEVGIRYHMGYVEMVRANPKVNRIEPLPAGTKLLVPSLFRLPKPHEGIVINLAEYRLYYFPLGDNVVLTYPVGIGRVGWETPLGKTTVISKELNPVWRPSLKLQREAAKHGVLMPEVFPAGPANPLGTRALRLGWATYLIHGSNHRETIGRRISAGCIRMLPEDINYLFDHVPTGTVVRVVNEPVKRAN